MRRPAADWGIEVDDGHPASLPTGAVWFAAMMLVAMGGAAVRSSVSAARLWRRPGTANLGAAVLRGEVDPRQQECDFVALPPAPVLLAVARNVGLAVAFGWAGVLVAKGGSDAVENPAGVASAAARTCAGPDERQTRDEKRHARRVRTTP